MAIYPNHTEVGQVLSTSKTDSAPMKVQNAIALSKRRFVLNLKYAAMQVWK